MRDIKTHFRGTVKEKYLFLNCKLTIWSVSVQFYISKSQSFSELSSSVNWSLVFSSCDFIHKWLRNAILGTECRIACACLTRHRQALRLYLKCITSWSATHVLMESIVNCLCCYYNYAISISDVHTLSYFKVTADKIHTLNKNLMVWLSTDGEHTSLALTIRRIYESYELNAFITFSLFLCASATQYKQMQWDKLEHLLQTANEKIK